MTASLPVPLQRRRETSPFGPPTKIACPRCPLSVVYNSKLRVRSARLFVGIFTIFRIKLILTIQIRVRRKETEMEADVMYIQYDHVELITDNFSLGNPPLDGTLFLRLMTMYQD
ncbi:hypothetical protein ACLKA6_003999 [Drosophila palustris]